LFCCGRSARWETGPTALHLEEIEWDRFKRGR
jgi:hypothetical protein